MRVYFNGINGIHPDNLGIRLPNIKLRQELKWDPVFGVILKQYYPYYRTLLWNVNLEDYHLQEIISWMKAGALYDGSDGSEKNGRSAHAFGFTSSKVIENIWRGYAITPGSI